MYSYKSEDEGGGLLTQTQVFATPWSLLPLLNNTHQDPMVVQQMQFKWIQHLKLFWASLVALQCSRIW